QGFAGFPPDRLNFLTEADSRGLLLETGPDAPVTPGERREVLAEVLSWWEAILPHLEERLSDRARRVRESHRRVRAAARLARRGVEVRPKFPPDLLGLLVLLPVPKGVVK
ncbi:helicase, partial [Candidatus Bipolaricaulota bacterium]|nr:helicase [Candidatus Bipolaricaulota bacterium]